MDGRHVSQLLLRAYVNEVPTAQPKAQPMGGLHERRPRAQPMAQAMRGRVILGVLNEDVFHHVVIYHSDPQEWYRGERRYYGLVQRSD